VRAAPPDTNGGAHGDFGELTRSVTRLSAGLVQRRDRVDTTGRMARCAFRVHLLKELLRSARDERPPEDFVARLTEAGRASAALRLSLSTAPLDAKAADTGCQRLTDDCAACHKRYRN
jgi:hypothetical protein